MARESVEEPAHKEALALGDCKVTQVMSVRTEPRVYRDLKEPRDSLVVQVSTVHRVSSELPAHKVKREKQALREKKAKLAQMLWAAFPVFRALQEHQVPTVNVDHKATRVMLEYKAVQEEMDQADLMDNQA